MKPRVAVITLGVDDLERALTFYRDGLGLVTEGIIGEEFEYGAVAFFALQPGLQLALWPRSSIGRDTALAPSQPSPTEFTLGHNVASRDEVDDVIEQARRAGAFIVREPHDTKSQSPRASFTPKATRIRVSAMHTCRVFAMPCLSTCSYAT